MTTRGRITTVSGAPMPTLGQRIAASSVTFGTLIALVLVLNLVMIGYNVRVITESRAHVRALEAQIAVTNSKIAKICSSLVPGSKEFAETCAKK